MNFSLLSVLAALAFLALALWVTFDAIRNQASRRLDRGLFAFAAAVSGLWAGVWSVQDLQALDHTEGLALWLDGLRQLAWMAWLFVALGLSHVGSGPWRGLRWVVPSVCLLALGLWSSSEWRWFGRAAHAVAPAYAGLALSILGLVLLEQLYRNAPEDRRWNVKPLALGLVCMYGFDLYLFAEAVLLQRQDRAVFSLRPMVHVVGLPLLAIGLRRGSGLRGRLGMSRDAVFHSAALMLAGVYLILVAAMGYWLRFTGGDWGLALQLLLMVGAVLLLGVLLLSGSARARLRVWLSKHFLHYRYDYRQEWSRFTAALAERLDEGNPGAALLRALANLVESPGGGLWRSNGAHQVQVSQWNFDRNTLREPTDSAFVQALAARPWIVDLNAERAAPSGAVPVPSWLLEDREAWLVIPLLAAGDLQGWVVLTQPRANFPLNWEVLDLLRNAASQAAGHLALLKASDQLLEARKFEAFNRMSAFVVHDLKNIVTQLSLMLRNAQRHGDNPEFQRDMLETVDNAVEKMRQLMTQLREGERPTGVASGVSLLALVKRLQAQAAQRGRQLNLVEIEALSTRGHAERVERVIGHAVQNAFEASQDGQTVQLRLERLGSYAKLQVQDQGCGMSAEFIREHLFKPFQSTKAQGMGIGVYESLQYIQELGGKMEVDSEPGRGTIVSFFLPLFHVHSTHSMGSSAAPAETP
jgi:putative PEP-CTERM system histidine kinase